MRLEIISKQPRALSHATPLLFVHGAWHGAWCWDQYFLDYFAQHGFEAHALSLRGHGASDGRSRLRWARLMDYVKDTAQVARQLSRPPVVIGHSLGGAVVQKYLETQVAPAGAVVASLPPGGVLAMALRVARRHPTEFARSTLTLSLFPLVATQQLTRELLFSPRLRAEQVATYAARLQDESYSAFLDVLGLALPRPQRVTAPVLVLGAAQDMLVDVSEVEATAKAYGTAATIFPEMGHDMMLEPDWQMVADRILAWLDEQHL